MTETLDQLYARWIENRTLELQQAAQQLLQSEDPEAALRAELDEQPTGLLDAFADKVRTDEPDGPFVPELGRRVSRDEARQLLERWNEPLSPPQAFDASDETRAAMTAEFERINQEFEDDARQLAERQRAEWEGDWRANNLNRG